ncbi:hypothetical protein COO60DRAFT_1671076 [Scenedesmus sp. NREL 46B-D3]|nr:hypothetical protein COO60DRAFT_1671076 [Scenedesmus sp. NREL 46B-D3]
MCDIESLLKQWAGTFQIPDADLMQRLTDATSGELQRPPDRREAAWVHRQLPSSKVQGALAAELGRPGHLIYGLLKVEGLGGRRFELGWGIRWSYKPAHQQQPAAAAASAATGAGPFVPSGSKRQAAGDAGGGSSKRYKTLPVVDSSDAPFANIGPALGRRVLRYWPKDAGRNKGDPWFAAVVTDYEEDTGAHILTYQFGTQKEEKERVALALKQPNELRLTDDFVDLLDWYGDPKKRRKSSAVEKSVYLRKQYQALHGNAPGSARGKSGKAGSKAHSSSALSSGYSM